MRPFGDALFMAHGEIVVVRRHGLGDVLLLARLMSALLARGHRFRLVTRAEWQHALAGLFPALPLSAEADACAVDLDAATRDAPCREHRISQFARLLQCEPPSSLPTVQVPPEWQRPFKRWTGAIGFGPEAGHPSRRWPQERAACLARELVGAPLVLLGTSPGPPLECDEDSRGRLAIHEALGLLSLLRCVVCMDSGLLHAAAMLGKPTVAVFGGIDPAFRVTPGHKVIALTGDVPCRPCNKRETCDGRFDCLGEVTVAGVIRAVRQVTARG